MPDTPAKPSIPRQAGREFGRSGTAIHGGIITAEEYNRDLQGKNAIRAWDVMRRSDPTVRAMIQVCVLPLLSANWRIEQNEDDPDGERKQQDIERMLFKGRINWHAFMREAFSFVPFGHSVFEKVLGIDHMDGRPMIVPYKLASRKQISILKWETDDGKPGITQLLTGTDLANVSVSIPMEKLIVFTHDKEGDNYEGISMLRYAYKPWKIKDSLELVNAIALEKQGVGVPQIKRDPEQPNAVPSAEDIERARAAARAFRANEEGYWDATSGLILEMLDMKGASTKEIIPTIEYYDRQIVKSVLAQFLELGQGASGGSRALSEDQTALFQKSLEALAKTFASAVQEQLINQLCDLNYSDNSAGYPQLVFDGIADTDTAALSDNASKMVAAGLLTPDIDVEKHIRDVLKLPKMTPDAEKEYEEKRLQARQAAQALADNPPAPALAKGDKTDLPDDQGDKPGKIKASAIEDLLNESRDLKRRLIKVSYED